MRLRVGVGHRLEFKDAYYSAGDTFDVADEHAARWLDTGMVLPADGVWPQPPHREETADKPERAPSVHESATTAHELCDPGPKPTGTRSLSVCTVVGCPCQVWKGRCKEHARHDSGGRRYRDSYASPLRRRWDTASRAYLRDNPLCVGERCAAVPSPLRPAATEVDHIDGLGLQGPRAFDPSNWQALCHRCHSSKTARESFGH